MNTCRFYGYLFVVLLAVRITQASEKLWTGGGSDQRFSLDDNWNPTGAPADGDTLLFNNTSDLAPINDLVSHTLGGLIHSGSGKLTLDASGNAFTLAGDLRVEGSGELEIKVPVTIDQAVTFNLTNANLSVYQPLSGTGSITLEGGKSLFVYQALTLAAVSNNFGVIYVNHTGFTAPVTLNQFEKVYPSKVALSFATNGTYHIPITITGADGQGHTITSSAYVTNTAPITLANRCYTRVNNSRSITFAGGLITEAPLTTSDGSIVFNGNNIIRDIPLAFENTLYVDDGIFRLAVANNTYSDLRCYTQSIITDVPYALDPDAPVRFGTSYKKVGTLDLNGCDQIINRPFTPLEYVTTSADYNLTSSSRPATLTCQATESALFFGKLNGAITLSWEPLSNDYSLILTGCTSQTSGNLQVKAGTLILTPDAQFPNLAEFSITSNGILRVENPNIKVCPLTIADSGVLNLPSGITMTCLTTTIDGVGLAVGSYNADSRFGGRAFITGEGTLQVLTLPLSGTIRTWTGAGSDTLFSNPDNWNTAPLFNGGEIFLFSEAGTSALVDGTYKLGDICFSRSTNFEILAQDSESSLELGAGNLSVLNPTEATLAVTNTLAVPLKLLQQHDFMIASNQTLALSGTLSGGTAHGTLTRTGEGTLILTGTNTFESPLVLSNGFTIVNNGTALGNPTNTLTLARYTTVTDNWNQKGAIYFTDLLVTNQRPITVANNVEYIGQIYPKNGTLVLNGKVTFNYKARIDNQGTLIFRGGLKTLSQNISPWFQTLSNYAMRFEEQPLDLNQLMVAFDNTGLSYVASTNNIWNSIQLSSSTFQCGAPNVLPSNAFVRLGASFTLNGKLDLNGYDQQITYLENPNIVKSTTNLIVHSDLPATLTLQGDTTPSRSVLARVMGALTLRYRNNGQLTFTSTASASTTTGDLLIESGKVAFSNGATWTGSTNITVTAGTLSIESLTGYTFGGNRAENNITRLHLSSSSKVYLAAGVTEYVRSATLDREHLPIGTYGSAESDAQYKSANFTGTGVLQVMRSDAPGTLVLIN